MDVLNIIFGIIAGVTAISAVLCVSSYIAYEYFAIGSEILSMIFFILAMCSCFSMMLWGAFAIFLGSKPALHVYSLLHVN